MKRFIVLLALVAGCGGSPIPADRLASNGWLRDACNAYGYGDPEIETMLSMVEEGRLMGADYTYWMASMQVECAGSQACLTCSVQVIDQVYGR